MLTPEWRVSLISLENSPFIDFLSKCICHFSCFSFGNGDLGPPPGGSRCYLCCELPGQHGSSPPPGHPGACHQGIAVALGMVQTQSGNDLQTLHPVFPQGEACEDFEELVDEIDGVAASNAWEIKVNTIVNAVFLGDD